MNVKQGEISTVVILTTFAILAVATLVTTTLNKEIQTTETRAGETACPLGTPTFVSGSNHFLQTTLPVCQVTVPQKEKEYVCAIIQDDNPNDGGADDILIAAQDPKGGPASAINWVWNSNGVGSVPLYKYVDTIDSSKTLKIVTYSFKKPTCVTTATIPASTVIALFAGNNSGGGGNDGGGGGTNPTTAATNPQAANQTCSATGLYVEVTNNNISKFEVKMNKSSDLGPKVARADILGNKGTHIEGPAFNSTFWADTSIGNFSSIEIADGASRDFYIEIERNNNSICYEKAYNCSNSNGTISCAPITQGAAPTATTAPGTTSAPTPTSNPGATPSPTPIATAATSATPIVITVSDTVYLPTCDGSTLASAAQGVGINGVQECIMITPPQQQI
ncbi:MAG: hypothetical protein O3B87_01475 [bacterium]|nr:hypothetical protein [bacterium]